MAEKFHSDECLCDDCIKLCSRSDLEAWVRKLDIMCISHLADGRRLIDERDEAIDERDRLREALADLAEGAEEAGWTGRPMVVMARELLKETKDGE